MPSQRCKGEEKCKQPNTRFELESSISFPLKITLTLLAPSQKYANACKYVIFFFKNSNLIEI